MINSPSAFVDPKKPERLTNGHQLKIDTSRSGSVDVDDLAEDRRRELEIELDRAVCWVSGPIDRRAVAIDGESDRCWSSETWRQ